MSTQITLTLPDELFETAQQWSVITHRDLTQTLTDALKLVLTPVHAPLSAEKPVSKLSDRDVLVLVNVQPQSTAAERMSALLKQQREGELRPTEQAELLALVQLYNRLWVRQSEALAEAVRRGLRQPLEP